mmetsp:Transcript_74273/g.170266  ORF Transcript_74273/g.170266 Transcript_74273/m.170266 type:complete len:192 (-) Transcript_74273:371-946(-)
MVEVQVAPCHPRSVLFDACRMDLSELEPRVLGVLKSFVAQQSSRLALAEEQHSREAEVLREQQAVARADREEVASALQRFVQQCGVRESVIEPQLSDDTRLAHRVSAYCQALVEAYEVGLGPKCDAQNTSGSRKKRSFKRGTTRWRGNRSVKSQSCTSSWLRWRAQAPLRKLRRSLHGVSWRKTWRDRATK